jgi:acyl-CoA thioester hydrolase
VRYLRPARLDDWLMITVDIRERGRASLRIAQQAWCGETLLAEGDIRIGCVERASMKPHRIPSPILEAIE